jgi:hypothetical protein
MKYDPVLFALHNIEIATTRYEYERDPFALTKLCDDYERLGKHVRFDGD